MKNKVVKDGDTSSVPEMSTSSPSATAKTVISTSALAAQNMISSDEMSIYRSIEQSLRVRTGLGFNDDVTKMLNRVSDGTNVVFVKAEPEFEKRLTKRGFKYKPIYLQMDHEFLIIDHDKMEILCVLSDGTTTFRNDRAKIKRAEGVDQMRLKDEIEKKLLDAYPQYKDYCITHINLFVFPSKLNCSLRRKAMEEKAIREFCINTNYSTNSFRSVVGCHQIDAAMTINEMEAVIKELSTNRAKYSFTQNAFANAWKNLYNTMDYLPTRELSIDNAENHKDQLLYSLDHHPNDYSRKELIDFAKICGICPWRKTWTNKAMIRAIRTYIDNNF
jgi:hypothetical protein